MIDIPAGFSPLVLQSPFALTLGAELHHRRVQGRRVIGVRVRPEHCNIAGAAHGGFLLALADFGLTYEAAGDDFPPRVTVSLSVDFIAPARCGDWIELEVRVLRSGRSLAFADAVGVVAGQVVMTASGVFKPHRPETA